MDGTAIPLDDDSIKQQAAVIPVPMRNATGYAKPIAPVDSPPVVTPAPSASPNLSGKPIMPILAPNGKPIPMGRVPGISGTIDPGTNLYNAPPPNQPGVAALWSKAENIHNPILRVFGEIGAGAARALDTAGSIVAPHLTSRIPGTTANKEAEVAKENAQENQDIENAEKKATTSHTEAETGAIPSTVAHTEAETAALQHPKIGLTPEEGTLHDLMTGGDNGGPKINPSTNQPYSYLDAYQAVKQAGQDAKPEKTPNDFEQFYGDWLKDNHFPDTSHNRLMARQQYAAAGQTPQKPQQQLGVIDGKIVELKPGMTVPEGTQSLTGDLKGGKPTADEQRRADLARNMSENLDQLEDIARRRPELFGPVAGRITGAKEFIGTSDPDVAALKTIKEQTGMAMVGAHAMRNAQHVETAANSITNAEHNTADAVLHQIAEARNSLRTFLSDEQRQNKGEKPEAPSEFRVPAGAPEAPKEDGHTLKANGQAIAVSKGGQWVQVPSATK